MRQLLHIGCGHKRKDQTTNGFNLPEWGEIRFDIDPAVEPDITGSMIDMAAVETESVDAIFSSHNLEHLYPMKYRGHFLSSSAFSDRMALLC